MARLFDDASSQYLEVASVPTADMPLSIACWFYTDSDSALQSLVTLADVTASSKFYRLQAEGTVAGDPVQAVYARTSTVSAATTSGYSTNTWHHALGTFTSVDLRTAYIDGGSKGTEATNMGVFTPTALAIGRSNDSSPDRYVSGSIAEVAIWIAVLTDDEAIILARGYSPLLVRPQSLVFYLPGIRDADQDIVGGLSLTPVNAPTISAHPRVFYPAPLWTPIAAAGGAPPVGNPWYSYAQM